MTLDEIIKSRRSIRKYQQKPVARELIEQCIEAARLAPSACNSQPCRFVVLDDKTVKENFCQTVFTGLYASCKNLGMNAPVLIAVCAKAGGNITTRLGQVISGTKFYLIDTGIAVEHLVLKAQDLGLGTCWNKNKKGSAIALAMIFSTAMLLIALGYPDEFPSPRPRKEFKDIVSYNGY